MTYRKFTADNIFTGYEMLTDRSVLLTDENGTILDIVPPGDAGGDIERLNGTLTPGFVNCHCHLELSHMKGAIPPGTGMVDFLLTVMKNRNDFSGNIVSEIANAEKSMADSGIVAAGDICNTDNTVAQKRQQNIHYHNFIETTGFVETAAQARFDQAREVCQKFSGNTSIVPHAPYSVSGNLLDLVNGHQQGSLLTIHNQESHAENELFLRGEGDLLELYKTFGIDISGFKKTGKTSIQSYLDKISGDHSVILVHNTVTSMEDVGWIMNNKRSLPELFWCVCPNANLYINNMLADVPMLMMSGYKMVVGTDSLASNHQLNIIEELKTLQYYFPSLTVIELLKWATLNGAEALAIADRYGSFEKGKTPGVVLIENIESGLFTNAFSRRIL